MEKENQVSKDTRSDKSVRPKRVPLGQKNRLKFENLDEAHFHYHVINDVGDRIKNAQRGGYEFVEAEQDPGILRVAEASQIGGHVSRSVGQGTTAYLMKIPLEWYNEDKAAEQKAVDDTEKALKPNKAKEEYGPGLTDE